MNLEAINAQIWYHTTDALLSTPTLRTISLLAFLAVRYEREEAGTVALRVVKSRAWPFKNSPFWNQLRAAYPSIKNVSGDDTNPILVITDPFDCIKFKFDYAA